ncbi:GGDEF domain-containing protein [Streptomyces microflavus]|uniref:GGDEF domain-containing protein n=1 Tax=Streptomyces microflavus TaxID=1919 RepID=UPI0029A3F267|nr:GGDEF domain-containing protein [Streptomyces microflavus]MDX2402142.1 GGDEF domain-containing protein [Streptomyces microflavus]
MNSAMRLPGIIGPNALLITAAAVPLTGWALHAVSLYKQIADGRKDPLTDLPCRPEFVAYGERLLGTRRRNAVHVLMLDRVDFKAVNDTYGHTAGDTVIQALGRRLVRWSSGRKALAARLGGDKFAVCAVIPPSAALAEITALREQLRQPIQHDGLTLRLDVSIGIARAADLSGEDMSQILRGADTAMYKVKKDEASFPYVATRDDACAETVNGRRAGRRGTHLLADAA